MIGFYNYTVIATYLSLAISLSGMLFAAAGKTHWAVICLMLSGLLDAFDGKIARTKKDRSVREQRFGVQIDSLCDLVCFGVLPVIIGYFAAPHGLNSVLFYIYAVCGVLHVLGGVIRLSFFNIGEEEKRDQGIKVERSTYTGMPITTVALIYPIIYLFRRPLADHPDLFTAIWSFAMLAIAFLFVGKFHIRKPTNKGIIILIVFGAVIACGIGFIYGICSK
ncbi:MAG: CDP-alcohol phosphatidyltransferase family protein [Clostridia bacterium]|nr:CDP-alcohol phosphatidyltransferase family protein [Clostridia bacterium]